MRKKARFSRENVTILDSLLAGPSPFCLALTPSTLPLRLPPPCKVNVDSVLGLLPLLREVGKIVEAVREKETCSQRS